MWNHRLKYQKQREKSTAWIGVHGMDVRVAVNLSMHMYILSQGRLSARDGFRCLDTRIIRIRIRQDHQYGYPYSF
jgi:hypothetical protein